MAIKCNLKFIIPMALHNQIYQFIRHFCFHQITTQQYQVKEVLLGNEKVVPGIIVKFCMGVGCGGYMEHVTQSW